MVELVIFTSLTNSSTCIHYIWLLTDFPVCVWVCMCPIGPMIAFTILSWYILGKIRKNQIFKQDLPVLLRLTYRLWPYANNLVLQFDLEKFWVGSIVDLTDFGPAFSEKLGRKNFTTEWIRLKFGIRLPKHKKGFSAPSVKAPKFSKLYWTD